MKRSLITGFALSSLLFASTLFAADTRSRFQLMNGGFEQVENGEPTFWNVVGPKDGFLVSETTRIEGKNSVKITLNKHSAEGMRLQQSVEVEAGRRYDLGGAVKASLESGATTIMVTFLDKNGTDIETHSLPEAVYGQNWSYQNVWIKSPNGADVANIICFAKGKGEVWFDDIYFTTKIRGGY